MPAHAGAVAELQIEEIKVRILPDGRMTRRDAARYLGNAEKTLAMWELQGKGPPSVKVGGRRFYYRNDLDAFIKGDAT
jgi:DNA-binding transcriptional regulator YiaG